MGLASVPNAERNCMLASSAPSLPQASGSSAPSLSRNASPTSALAMTAPSSLSAPPWSEKRRRHQAVFGAGREPFAAISLPSTIYARRARLHHRRIGARAGRRLGHREAGADLAVRERTEPARNPHEHSKTSQTGGRPERNADTQAGRRRPSFSPCFTKHPMASTASF